MSVYSANVRMMRGLEFSIAVDIRRQGFASDKKATNWPGCLRHKKPGEKPDEVGRDGAA
jgi:hypothetical protein